LKRQFEKVVGQPIAVGVIIAPVGTAARLKGRDYSPFRVAYLAVTESEIVRVACRRGAIFEFRAAAERVAARVPLAKVSSAVLHTSAYPIIQVTFTDRSQWEYEVPRASEILRARDLVRRLATLNPGAGVNRGRETMPAEQSDQDAPVRRGAWYPDPYGSALQQRWYDGTKWTREVRPTQAGEEPPRVRIAAPLEQRTPYTFTKQAFWFDARGLRGLVEEAARTYGIELSVVRESRRLLTVTMEFAASGTGEQLNEFRTAIKPKWSALPPGGGFG
jgi:hypothetical protein